MGEDIIDWNKVEPGKPWSADSEIDHTRPQDFWMCILFDGMYEGKQGNCPYCLEHMRQTGGSNYDMLLHRPYKEVKYPFFFTDQYKKTFACVRLPNGAVANFPLYSKAFKGIAAQHVRNQIDSRGNHLAPTREHINTYLSECEADAYDAGLRYDIYNRAARFGEDYYVDLCDEEWRTVRFNKKSWAVIDMQPFPMFTRYAHMQPITIAATGSRDAFDRFIGLLHVSEDYRMLIQTYTILTGLAGIQQVILYMTGSQGSVKSTAQELIGAVFDPTITETLTLPHQQRELVQQLMHHYAPVYDNVDAIPDDIASDLCRACTGGGFEKRELYTDDDDVIYRYRRKVMLNGINLSNHRPDFVERLLLVVQERVPKEERRPKEEVVKEAQRLLPEVRAYCFDMLVKAIGLYEEVGKQLKGKLPRMADYCIWAECVARALGYEQMQFYRKYMELQDTQTLDALLADTVGELVLAWLEGNEAWKDKDEVTIAPSDLFNQLKTMAESRGYNLKQIRFPGNATWLSHRLNNLKHSLAEYGIRFRVEKSRTSNLYCFTNSSTTSTTPQARLQTEGGAIQNSVEPQAASSTKVNVDGGASGAGGAISEQLARTARPKPTGANGWCPQCHQTGNLWDYKQQWFCDDCLRFELQREQEGEER